MSNPAPAVQLTVDAHPALRHGAFVSSWPCNLETVSSPIALIDLLAEDADAPLAREEDVRQAVRDLLRHGGYKPTGRGKPASEYLVKAAAAGKLGTINAAVDCCNAVSLHSGFPISVVDLDRVTPPLRIGIADPGEKFVFNASGQEIDLAGLLCLFDAAGACANAVKDSQRTKTGPSTTRTLSVVWGCRGHEGRLERAVAWYRELVESTGGATETAPAA
ncbi:MAG: phenylalanine--tRNA ligase beta subunit-related protein [Planctomycetota bacterium]|jgi:DNA/RNA-binding domain of Phe-tRNA-synthetase-like protein